ncbi:MAG: zinc-ribbon domain-containing protein [Candidatus Heimdallarchaeota archaeon]|nr:zinc-ribbon domain-containing protein [Candidatus Heimdallarchaeota archaeon]
MSYGHQVHPFDLAKRRISDSSSKLYSYLLTFVIISVIMVIVAVILFYVVLVPLGYTLNDFDPNDIYESIETIVVTSLLAIGVLAIGIIILLILFIMIYVQYYKLGSGFSLLQKADPMSTSPQNASYGIMGYVIAVIIGFFVPGYAGTAISLAGNISLIVGFYFVYKTFTDYTQQGRFNQPPTKMLFIAVTINFISSIVAFFTMFSSIGTIVGFIFLLIGFRDLSRDITLILPPGAAPTSSPAAVPVKQEQYPIQPAAVEPSVSKKAFCSSCGAKISQEESFCSNCGTSI